MSNMPKNYVETDDLISFAEENGYENATSILSENDLFPDDLQKKIVVYRWNLENKALCDEYSIEKYFCSEATDILQKYFLENNLHHITIIC